MQLKQCKQCKKEVDVLTIFSKGECLECHEKDFKTNIDAKKVLDGFFKTINI